MEIGVILGYNSGSIPEDNDTDSDGVDPLFTRAGVTIFVASYGKEKSSTYQPRSGLFSEEGGHCQSIF